MQKAYFDSPIGVLEICGDESGVCEINFVRDFVRADVMDANLAKFSLYYYLFFAKIVSFKKWIKEKRWIFSRNTKNT